MKPRTGTYSAHEERFMGIGVSQTDVERSSVVRIYNSDENYTGRIQILNYEDLSVVAQTTLEPGEVVYIEKKSEDYVAGDGHLKYIGCAYSSMMYFNSHGSSNNP